MTSIGSAISMASDYAASGVDIPIKQPLLGYIFPNPGLPLAGPASVLPLLSPDLRIPPNFDPNDPIWQFVPWPWEAPPERNFFDEI